MILNLKKSFNKVGKVYFCNTDGARKKKKYILTKNYL